MLFYHKKYWINGCSRGADQNFSEKNNNNNNNFSERKKKYPSY
jgi:hypothetical protein